MMTSFGIPETLRYYFLGISGGKEKTPLPVTVIAEITSGMTFTFVCPDWHSVEWGSGVVAFDGRLAEEAEDLSYRIFLRYECVKCVMAMK